uniref:Uncharacterized protein n=1 Tax=Physcomitrium patens TaxID=3218 RepID=A0A2K1KUC3_PHYPA|nr:hypothetical protein PHYPA_004344 [Physcomitrium patens]
MFKFNFLHSSISLGTCTVIFSISSRWWPRSNISHAGNSGVGVHGQRCLPSGGYPCSNLRLCSGGEEDRGVQEVLSLPLDACCS